MGPKEKKKEYIRKFTREDETKKEDGEKEKREKSHRKFLNDSGSSSGKLIYIVIYELFTQWIIHRRKIGILATLDRTWYAIWKGVCSEVRYARETLYLNAISSRPGWMRALWYAFIDKITNNDRQTAAFESYIVATCAKKGERKKLGKCRILFILAFVSVLLYFFWPIDKLVVNACNEGRKEGKRR